MTLSRYRPIVTICGASLLVLSACSPGHASKPYEPAEPDAQAEEDVPASAFMDQAEVFSDVEVPAAGEDPDADPALDAEEPHAGEPHVHGGGDLSVTREDDFLTITLDAPLDNFGLPENKAIADEKAEAYTKGIVKLLGPTDCEQTESSANARTNGEHGAMTISVVWRCKKIDRVEGLTVNVFDLYPGFHHIDAIYLGPDGEQVAKELTPEDAELDFD